MADILHSKDLIVRSAVDSDVEWLVTELKAFAKFFGTRKSLFGNEAYARTGMLSLITQHIVYVAEKRHTGPVGFIAGMVTNHLFNPEIRVLNELFWWVSEEYRKSRAGFLLLDVFVKWGKSNCDWINFALESHTPVKDSALIKRGFHLHEKSFLLEVA